MEKFPNEKPQHVQGSYCPETGIQTHAFQNRKTGTIYKIRNFEMPVDWGEMCASLKTFWKK
jgi:hypothetical protein